MRCILTSFPLILAALVSVPMLTSSAAAAPEVPVCTDSETEYPAPPGLWQRMRNYRLNLTAKLDAAMAEADRPDFFTAGRFGSRDEVAKAKHTLEELIELTEKAKLTKQSVLKIQFEELTKAKYAPEDIQRAEVCVDKSLAKELKSSPYKTLANYHEVLDARMKLAKAGIPILALMEEHYGKWKKSEMSDCPFYTEPATQKLSAQLQAAYDDEAALYSALLVEKGLAPAQ